MTIRVRTLRNILAAAALALAVPAFAPAAHADPQSGLNQPRLVVPGDRWRRDEWRHREYRDRDGWYHDRRAYRDRRYDDDYRYRYYRDRERRRDDDAGDIFRRLFE